LDFTAIPHRKKGELPLLSASPAAVYSHGLLASSVRYDTRCLMEELIVWRAFDILAAHA
jgi:hypothetical protein